jgi:hypothetical protein
MMPTSPSKLAELAMRATRQNIDGRRDDQRDADYRAYEGPD